jgi:regulatory protein
MKITAISEQVRNPDRVNVSVDGKYSFSLDIFQLGELGVKVGLDLSEEEFCKLKEESVFGKVYARAVEYCFSRPHSGKELRDYLYRKTYPKRDKTGKTIDGISKALTEKVFERLSNKGYVDDHKFAVFWVENRMQRRGISMRRLQAELYTKGVSSEIIKEVLSDTVRSDEQELTKIVATKRHKYPDEKKFIYYLTRLGFSYDDIRDALKSS